MPIVFSYDLKDAEPKDHNRIQSMFQRFGWENIGGSCFRYPELPRLTKTKPKLTANQSLPREDWLNYVVPALMCFRAYVLRRKLKLRKHSIDIQTSSGSHGAQPKAGSKMKLNTPTATQFGEIRLRNWIDQATAAIPAIYR